MGEEIILESRIMAVADIVEAMASHRPYRPGLGIKAALTEITVRAGTQLDERVVETCVQLFTKKNYVLPAD
ncbi:metal dependent phosphohydrolase [mine drainage metagenome]|uniref:Metal dependent phosphohydrolase n=2 Tax=mine drainage metagenome TaxID=410659 RepID=T0ZE85_9ZZZZ